MERNQGVGVIHNVNSDETKLLNFQLTAPGKIILFGEYSVIFNKPAVASTLSKKTCLTFKETSHNVVCLKFYDLKIDKIYSLADIKKNFNFESTCNWREYLESLTDSLTTVDNEVCKTEVLTDSKKQALIAFFHCFGNCFHGSSGFELAISTTLKIGSGTGSSASFSVVLAAAKLIYENYLKDKNSINKVIERNENGYSIVEKFKSKISEMAFSCEKIFHGSPSGLDNTIILHGSTLEFTKSSDGNNALKWITTCPIRIMIVNTKVSRNTRLLVNGVTKLMKNHPEVVGNVFNAIEHISKSAVNTLDKLNNPNEKEKSEKYFEELITLNHNLLRVLGVSHPSLERIVSIAQKFNLSAKLTGAGGGGYAFIYLPSYVDELALKKLQMELQAEEFEFEEVTLGNPGLSILNLDY